MNALAGPLHGLANQEVIRWVLEMVEKTGTRNLSKQQIADYITATLDRGKVVPGYGHAVLRITDPRYMAQLNYCKKYFPDDEIVNIIWKIYEVAPDLLREKSRTKNPWPNVDAHSGATLMHYGVTEYNFYTVLFGVSRAMGVLASLVWSRALNLPIVRPKSISFESLKALVALPVAK
jgi:citrate synthase